MILILSLKRYAIARMKTLPKLMRREFTFQESSFATDARVSRKHKHVLGRMVNRTRFSWVNLERTHSGRKPRLLSYSRGLVLSRVKSISGIGICSVRLLKTLRMSVQLKYLATNLVSRLTTMMKILKRNKRAGLERLE